MSVFLFSDFGAADPYVGQVKAVLAEHAREVAVIDLLHAAPAFNVRASAHLLAALAARLPVSSVTMAVVDPGVGSARDALALRADGSWFVGPDNGLLSVFAARAGASTWRRITWRPQRLAASFHGRDLFAPIAAALTRGEMPADKAETIARPAVDFGGSDLGEIIYIDHYGNGFTGLRAQGLAADARIAISRRSLERARVYADASPGELFWHENSLGLVEIAGNACNAAALLGLEVGQSVGICA